MKPLQNATNFDTTRKSLRCLTMWWTGRWWGRHNRLTSRLQRKYRSASAELECCASYHGDRYLRKRPNASKSRRKIILLITEWDDYQATQLIVERIGVQIQAYRRKCFKREIKCSRSSSSANKNQAFLHHSLLSCIESYCSRLSSTLELFGLINWESSLMCF